MPKVIKSAGRDIILKVKHACEEERANNSPTIPFSKVRARVAYLTGVSERTVTQITREGNIAAASSSKLVTPGKTRNRKKKIDEIDEFDKCTIRHIIQSFYSVKKDAPTINKLWQALRHEIDFKYSRTSLRNILKTMGYKYQKIQSNRKVLVESTKIQAWRANYINRLRKNRQEEHRPVIYLDVTDILTPYYKLRIQTTDTSKRRLITAHAGSKSGFLKNGLLMFELDSTCNDYQGGRKPDIYSQWIKRNILPNLPSNSIVVMNHGSFHGSQMNKAPTMGNIKADLQEWLKKNAIDFKYSWTKAQLYQLIKRHKEDPQYEIDQILNKQGHEVLRLPPFHCDLNPFTKIWDVVKTCFSDTDADQNKNKIASIIKIVFNTVTTQTWLDVCSHVEKIENKYFASDIVLDVEMDKFITISQTIMSDSSEEDTSIDSDDDMEGNNLLCDHTYC